jgi:hypothetical protein
VGVGLFGCKGGRSLPGNFFADDGRSDGAWLGLYVGIADGEIVGCRVGVLVGDVVGHCGRPCLSVGTPVGLAEGESVGFIVGASEGESEGTDVPFIGAGLGAPSVGVAVGPVVKPLHSAAPGISSLIGGRLG